MINVYDWFESFVLVLDTQRDRLRERKKQETMAAVNAKPLKKGASSRRGRPSASPTKKGDKAAQGAPDDEDSVWDEQDDENWKLEIQARFMRALHELDFLGFIKHTGRKADHVLRTVFDVAD